MAQQPHIELDRADLPRPELTPSASTWRPCRPGEITAPEQAEWGGSFGRPCPDAGWALRLVHEAEFDRGDRPDVLEQIVATTAGARASLAGRGPTSEDVEVALLLLGLRPEHLPDEVVGVLAAARRSTIDHAAHERDKGRSFLRTVPIDKLVARPGELLDMLAA